MVNSSKFEPFFGHDPVDGPWTILPLSQPGPIFLTIKARAREKLNRTGSLVCVPTSDPFVPVVVGLSSENITHHRSPLPPLSFLPSGRLETIRETGRNKWRPINIETLSSCFHSC